MRRRRAKEDNFIIIYNKLVLSKNIEFKILILFDLLYVVSDRVTLN